MLGHAFWTRVLGGDPSVVGRTIRVNGEIVEVVGVTASEFDGVSRGGFFPPTDITLTLSAQPRVYPRWIARAESLLDADDVFWLRVMARVPDEAAAPVVRSRLATAFRATPSPATQGDAPPPELTLGPGARGPEPAGADTARLLFILMGVVAAALLIACVNLASLMLARGAAREREMALRSALGSGRGRLIRQTLMEGALLSVAGATLAILLVVGSRGAVGAMLTTGIGSSAMGLLPVRPQINAAVIAVCAALTIAATLAFSLLPALRLSSLDPASFLQHRTAGAGPRLAAGRALIALQIGVSVPLIVGASLLLRTVSNLDAVELGFDPRGLVMFQVNPGYTRLPAEEHGALYTGLLRRMREIPGVSSATLVENALLSGIVSNTSVVIDDARHRLYMNAVGPDFLETMRMRLLDGRMPGIEDTADRRWARSMKRPRATCTGADRRSGDFCMGTVATC